jgi:hypothetical protein
MEIIRPLLTVFLLVGCGSADPGALYSARGFFDPGSDPETPTIAAGGSATASTPDAGPDGSGGAAGVAVGSSSGGASTSSCSPAQKLCGSFCYEITIPAFGCASTGCYACPSAPPHGSQICNAQGDCDFECAPGATKNGSQCDLNGSGGSSGTGGSAGGYAGGVSGIISGDPAFVGAFGAGCVSGAYIITHNNGIGDKWQDCMPLGTYDVIAALRACKASGASSCTMTAGCGDKNLVVCGYDATGSNYVGGCWGYSGSVAGYVNSSTLGGGGFCPDPSNSHSFHWG